MRRVRWGIAVMATIGTLLIVSSTAAAVATPPFTATPSYAAYGGLPTVGQTSVTSSGTGSNTVGTPPSFSVATGFDKQGETSISSGTGKHAMEVYSGVENVSFVCSGANCTNGTVYTSIAWNASWGAHVGTTCRGNSTNSSVFASVALAIFASVVDESTYPATVAGSLVLTLFSHSLSSPGSITGGKISHLYVLKFKTALVKGDSYTVLTYFEAYASTVAASSASAVCSSTAVERVGVHHPTVLEWIKVS